MLFAITLFPNPVYPGMGLSSFTYYLPSFSITLVLAHLLSFFVNDYLNLSDFERVNWSIYVPFWFNYLGYFNKNHTAWTKIVLLGTPTISAAVLCNISDGGIHVTPWVDTYLSFGSTSWPFT